jgi:hypothetical protein
VRLRRQHKWGPARIAPHVGLPVSTVHRILVRRGVNRLAWMDRLTGRVVRRYEQRVPSELVHMDARSQPVIASSSGVSLRAAVGARSVMRGVRTGGWTGGHDLIHLVVDDHSRLAYSEIPADETGDSCAGVSARAHDASSPRMASTSRP